MSEHVLIKAKHVSGLVALLDRIAQELPPDTRLYGEVCVQRALLAELRGPPDIRELPDVKLT